MKNTIITLMLAAGLLLGARAPAAMNDSVVKLQKRWAEVRYQLPEKQRKDGYKDLAKQADSVVASQPANAEAHIWAGIIYSTWAGDSGPFSAMKRVKHARKELEKALEIDPNALNGAAYTSLGALLYQIPGLLGGDDELAEKDLRKGLEMDPQGIDANYFYAAFLTDQKRYQEAKNYLKAAAAAPARPGRAVADAGRKHEIEALEQKVSSKLK